MSTNNYNVGWDNLADEATSGNNANFMRLNDGENQLRIVSGVAKLYVHFEKDINGGWHKIICNGTNTCPICQKGIRAQKKFCFNVIDRKDENKVKILEAGSSIASQLGDLAKDADYGSPLEYDIKIGKTGKGLNTNYTVTPRPKKAPLTEEEKEAVAAAPKVEDVMKVMSVEDIMNLNLECLADSLTDLGEEENTAAKSDVDDDWDDI